MPITQPSRSDVHVNRPLTNISIAFVQSQAGFVANEVFPVIPVQKESDVYFIWDRGTLNRIKMKVRAPGTESAGGTSKLSTDVYRAVRRGYHEDVSDQVRNNADSPLNLDRQATQAITLQEMITREEIWATDFFTPGDPGDTWTFDVDGVVSSPTAPGSFDPTDAANNDVLQWNDVSSTPIEDIRRGKRFVGKETGFRPNTLTLGREVFDVLIDHPDIIGRLDRGQTDGPAIASMDSLARLFELERVLVMDAIKNTATEGQADAHDFIGGKQALLSFRPRSPGLMTPSAGYTFANTSGAGSSPNGTRIKRMRIETIESDRIEIDSFFDHKVVSADLGYFFGAIVAN